MVFAAIAIVGIAALAMRQIKTPPQTSAPSRRRARLVPATELASDVSIVVRGWTRTELDNILAYFLRAYEITETSPVRVSDVSEGVMAIAFPAGIEPEKLFFLVNYLQYPKGYDVTQRVIGILARVVLTAAFDVPDSGLLGKRAMIYVPSHDTDYDLVYLRLDSGATYKISFTNLRWKPVDEARLPNSIVGL